MKYKIVLALWSYLHEIQEQATPIYGDQKSGWLWPEDGRIVWKTVRWNFLGAGNVLILD